MSQSHTNTQYAILAGGNNIGRSCQLYLAFKHGLVVDRPNNTVMNNSLVYFLSKNLRVNDDTNSIGIN